MAASTNVQAVCSNHQLVDEEVERDIGVQEHAAAVQLLNRSLALAHLRAELVKPRGRPVATKPKAAANMAAVKLEPGLEPLDDLQPQQQSQAWQLPKQPQQSAPPDTVPAMSITVSTTTLEVEPASAAASTQQTQQQPQQQTSRRHVQAGPRRGVPRPPDPAAAVRWQDEQGIPPDDVPLEGISATTKKVVQLQPRIRADPYMQAQRLAGWVRLGVEGAPEAAGDAGFQDEAGMDVDQPGDEEQAADDDDFIDEEWV